MHYIGASEYHLQWVTKYRYEILAKESHWKDYENVIRSAAQRHRINILESEAMKAHVNVVALIPPKMSVSHAIGLLKGSSSYDLFRNHPNLSKPYLRGHFWVDGTSTGR